MKGAPVISQLAREAVWHDLECGAYRADFDLWRELAAHATPTGKGARILDIGCGTGRVALMLAASGQSVAGLDVDRDLLAELRHRAGERGLDVTTVSADGRSFAVEMEFDLVLAPMQLVQLLRSSSERRGLLARARAHLRPGGLFAGALLDLRGEAIDGEFGMPLPDMREQDGWVYSSQPVAIRSLDRGRAISLDRLRRAVSPRGEVEEVPSQIRLELVSPPALEREARAAGLQPAGRITIPPTEDHVGSVAVTARRPGP